MKKTKIICSIGPASCNPDVMEAREIFKEYGREDIKVISKIESATGFPNNTATKKTNFMKIEEI